MHSSPYGPAGEGLEGTYPNPRVVADRAPLVLASRVFGSHAAPIPGPQGTQGAAGASSSAGPSGTAGRLTLESGVPVSTSDQMGKATVYWTPYKGNQVQLWDGANWTTYTSAEISLALGTITAALPYDIFMYQSAGTPTLELLAWTNATTRATAVTLQDGRYAKSGDKTRLYLGSFYTTATTTTEDSKRRRLLWNFYNRVRRDWIARDATTNWAYSLNAYRQARATATNQLEAMVGIAETAVEILSLNVVDTTSNGLVSAGIGINSTTVNSASLFSGLTAVTTATVMTTSQLREVRLGYTFYPWLERGFGTGTQTWYGVFGTSVQTGLVGTLEC